MTKEFMMQYHCESDTFDKVVSALEQTLYVNRNTLSPATRLVEDLQLGRFGRIKLALYLEETFDMEISDEAVDCFDTVDDITKYMRRWSLDGSREHDESRMNMSVG